MKKILTYFELKVCETELHRIVLLTIIQQSYILRLLIQSIICNQNLIMCLMAILTATRRFMVDCAVIAILGAVTCNGISTVHDKALLGDFYSAWYVGILVTIFLICSQFCKWYSTNNNHQVRLRSF